MPEADCDGLHERVVAYLFDRVEQERPYVKSRHVAAECDCSAKRVGHLLATIERDDLRLDLERRGGASDGTTWEITPADATES